MENLIRGKQSNAGIDRRVSGKIRDTPSIFLAIQYEGTRGGVVFQTQKARQQTGVGRHAELSAARRVQCGEAARIAMHGHRVAENKYDEHSGELVDNPLVDRHPGKTLFDRLLSDRIYSSADADDVSAVRH